jgi:hypothetical protein
MNPVDGDGHTVTYGSVTDAVGIRLEQPSHAESAVNCCQSVILQHLARAIERVGLEERVHHRGIQLDVLDAGLRPSFQRATIAGPRRSALVCTQSTILPSAADAGPGAPETTTSGEFGTSPFFGQLSIKAIGLTMCQDIIGAT